MSVTFSKELVKRYRFYMKKRCGFLLSEEQPQAHLASLARLYTSFAFSKQAGGVRDFSPRPNP